MSKYILELKDDVQVVQKVGVAENGNAFVMNFYKDQLKELNSDYINENFGELQDEAYNKGYAQCQDDYGDALKHAKDTAYKKGFEDGKAVHDKGCEGCKYANVAGTHEPCVRCSNSYGNQWTAKDDKIKVGDEVINILTKTKGILLEPETEHLLATVIIPSQRWRTFNASHVNLKKTGKHYDIEKLLEAMKA